jgi:lambda repressor-like predicted transcriptional regulator
MPMSALDRKVALLRAGRSMADIARSVEPKVTTSHVSQVLRGLRRSPRIEAAIAAAIDKAPDEVFPPAPSAPSSLAA